jgi:hypothetical protein
VAEVVRKNRKEYKGHPSLNNGTYRLEGSRLYFTPRGSTEQEYGAAREAGSLKLITSASVQVFRRKDGRFAE